ncbi:MAG TPA: cellulose synthase operon protein YhjQ/BcsQ, partial [Thermogutta sp.]|nr:cellulose synthase operon protein YhjQ/BcsQ [Thermogutta sp.]
MDQSGVMYDQAYHLRQLVSRIRPATVDDRQPTLQIRIYGVRQGVGTSTVAEALAHYLHQVGWNVCLFNGVPKNLGKPPAPFRVEHHGQWVETAMSHGDREQQIPTAFTTRGGREALSGTESRKTLVLRDCGVPNDPKELVSDYPRRCALVTTPAPTDIMKAYALLKRTTGVASPLLPTIVINKSADLSLGQEMAGRLQRACGRFLNRDLTSLFILPILPRTEGESVNAGEFDEGNWLRRTDGSAQHGSTYCCRREWEETIQLIAKALTEGV